ncbi:hypothetical protein BDN67DRAFT_985260 [Paxillus ammoniavirescens]|nr:hypothetical protein BDN67DRAFT_985260 [Paxillus ammoniavirescens]
MPRYNLRNNSTCTEATDKTAPKRTSSESSLSTPTPSLAQISSVDERFGRAASGVIHSYSNVVLARSSNQLPSQAAVVERVGVTSTAESSVSVDPPSNKKQFYIAPSKEGNEPQTSNSDCEDGEWKTVARQKRHVARPSGEMSPRSELIPLESEKAKTVHEAEKRLTCEEHECIRGRKGAEWLAQGDESSTLQGEGPSNLKGKQPDPRNWGGVDLNDPELDPEAQRRALRAWNNAWAWSCTGETTIEVPGPSSNVPDSEGNESYSKVETNTQWKDEAHLKAYYKKKLDQKLRKLRRKAANREMVVPDETPSVAGVAKGKDGPSARENQSVGKPDSRNPIAGMIDKALTKARGKEPRQSMSQVMEPAQQIVSKSYLGQALDRIGASRARDSPKSRQTPQDPSSSGSLSDNSESSDIHRAHQVPEDLLGGVCEKLKWAFQNERTIRDYVSELNELWNLIGDISERDKVMKLWFSLNGYIQLDLWRDKLHLEESSLSAVVNAAEVIEIAHSVSVTNDRKPRDWDRSAKGTAGSTSNQSAGGRSRPQKSESNILLRPPNCDRNHSRKIQGPRPGHSSGNRDKAGKGNGKPPGAKPPLSKEEHDQLAAEGRCFNCKETGHMSHNCPCCHTVPANGVVGPPGVSSYHIQLATDTEHLRVLAESTETSDMLTLNTMWIHENTVGRLEAESGV